MEQRQAFIRGAQGARIYCQVWEPPGGARAHLVVTHGQGEHSGCYHRFAAAMVTSGFQVWAWDLRGHGRSQGARGVVSDFELYEQDLDLFLKGFVFDQTQGKPLILVGHSMGGLIQLSRTVKDPDLAEIPQVLSAPFLDVAFEVPVVKKMLSRWAGSALPQLALNNGLQLSQMTSDPEVLEEFRRDPLRHFQISAGAFEGSQAASAFVFSRAKHLKMPILIVGPTEDPVVSTSKIHRLFGLIPSQNKSLKLFPGRKHEVFNDVGRDEVFEVVRAFIEPLTAKLLSL